MNAPQPTPVPENTQPPVMQIQKQNRVNSRLIIVAVISLVVLVGILAAGYYFFFYSDGINTPEDTNAATHLLREDEVEYTNDTYGFKMIINKSWNVNEFGTSVEFSINNESKIYFEEFNDSEFASVKSIDERFCESFETGFKEGIPDKEIAEQFDFVLSNQNGLDKCEAEGEIVEGFKQKYNVFYAPARSRVYTLFYTTSNPETEKELNDALESFQIVN